MSSAATPAKAKAFLASIKEHVVDKENDASLEALFLSFLCLEIFQRGVVVNQAPPQDDTTAMFLEIVQSVAGKALLMADSTSLPKPLVAGSLGMQGRIAEALASRLGRDDAAAASQLQQAFGKQVVAPVVRRCQEVHDDRFLVLMKLWHDEADDMVAVNLLTLAEGSYYRAASFSPDAPPTWKKAWETHSELQKKGEKQQDHSHWESYGSIPALESLCRIIKGKGNLKRASELSVRLASAWLDATDMVLNKSTGSQTPSSLTTKIEEAFVKPFRSLPSRLSADKTVARARESLSEATVTDNLSPEDSALLDIISLEILHMENRVGLASATEEVELQAKNRSSTLNTSQLAEKAKEAHFLSNVDENTHDHFSKAYIALERCLSKDRNDFLSPAAFSAVLEFISDHRETIWAKQKSSRKFESAAAQKLWMRLGQFAVTAVTMCPDQNASQVLGTASDVERNFWGELAHLVCQVSWMTFASHLENEIPLPFSADTFNFFHVVSNALCQEKREDALKAKTAAVSSKSRTEEVQYLHLRVTQLAIKCWTLLHKDSLESRNILEITNEMLSLVGSSHDLVELDADRGVTFLGSMLSWSGFFRPPWEFCIVPEARSLIQRARVVLKQSHSIYNRDVLALENILLNLAEADCECSGLTDKALRLYERTADSPVAQQDNVLSVFVRAKCLLGISQLESVKTKSGTEMTLRVDNSLRTLQSLSVGESALCIWKAPGIQHAALRFQIVISRQFIAQALVQVGRLQEAGKFLQEAVKDAPSDQVASFALGSFLLRMVFFHEHSSPEALKLVQTQLLKSAKLDSAKPGPFALLGYWYESKNDTKRSVGCYAKALILDPSHPVAGRGMIRLADESAKMKVIEKAISSASSLNGWAWLSIGTQKAKIDGEDGLAVSALLKTTRARDIEDPDSDPLAVFYSGPDRPEAPSHSELVKALIELSACYRRLGRCSAELRTLHSALEVSGVEPSWSLLHACARAEMEMGLMEDANERFDKASMEISGSRSLASLFGKGLTAFMMGRRDLQDGKAGVALDHIMTAISSCIPFAKESSSLSKLIGDMHTFLGAFPADLFDETVDPAATSDCFDTQMQLVARGGDFYSSALDKMQSSADQEDNAELEARIVCDGAVNLLLQAQLSADRQGLSGDKCNSDTKVLETFHLARDRFLEALRVDPLNPFAWCGLGCSLVDDPMKAQHAFSRAIGLDSAMPDSYANLGWLYLGWQQFDKGAEMCDVLTQVADTPMTWISRAYQLEKGTLDNESKESFEIEHISDAYRAALQMQKDPFSLLGLAASFRVSAETSKSCEPIEWENHTLVGEYQSITSSTPPDDIVIPSYDLKADESGTTVRESATGIKRAIIAEPDRGDAWLSLSKNILIGVSGEIDENSSESAKAAARRASALLLGKLTDSSSSLGTCGVVDARDLSDSLALENWLDRETVDGCKKKAQLALLVLPQNSLARELLNDDS